MNMTNELTYLIPIAIGAFTLGLSGFGFGIMSIAVMAHLTDDLEKGTAVLTASAIIVVGFLWRKSLKNGKVLWRDVFLLLCGTAIGQLIGYRFIIMWGVSPWFRIALGLTLLLFTWISWNGLKASREIPRSWAIPLGVLSGICSGAFVSGGPPLVLYLYSKAPENPKKMVATLQALFFINAIYRMGIAMSRGYGTDSETISLFLLTVPVSLVFLFLGYALSEKLSPKHFSLVAHILVCVMGVMTIIESVKTLL